MPSFPSVGPVSFPLSALAHFLRNTLARRSHRPPGRRPPPLWFGLSGSPLPARPATYLVWNFMVPPVRNWSTRIRSCDSSSFRRSYRSDSKIVCSSKKGVLNSRINKSLSTFITSGTIPTMLFTPTITTISIFKINA